MGPVRINSVVTDVTFYIANQMSEVRNVVHANKLKLFSDSNLAVQVELLDSLVHNQGHLNKVEKLIAVRYNSQGENWDVRVKCMGFDTEEPTWEPFEIL